MNIGHRLWLMNMGHRLYSLEATFDFNSIFLFNNKIVLMLD